ncbi:hypothetical protein, partial [Paenibacillus koleovorans]|uniref:hypothetical protein n=1 Tax=Paenibacillus koleovorans TaxID=121608 RepID=UPI001C3F94B3
LKYVVYFYTKTRIINSEFSDNVNDVLISTPIKNSNMKLSQENFILLGHSNSYNPIYSLI